MNVFQQFRERTGLTQGDLAAEMGVDQSTISLYERGKRTPELDNARRFIKVARKWRCRYTLDDVYRAYGSEAA